MIIHEDSNKLYSYMVACHQMMLEGSIIMHQIIHSFKCNWNACRNDYLTLNNRDQRGNFGDMETSIQIQKEMWLFLLFAQ